jgi:hypothetical protein
MGAPMRAFRSVPFRSTDSGVSWVCTRNGLRTLDLLFVDGYALGAFEQECQGESQGMRENSSTRAFCSYRPGVCPYRGWSFELLLVDGCACAVWRMLLNGGARRMFLSERARESERTHQRVNLHYSALQTRGLSIPDLNALLPCCL